MSWVINTLAHDDVPRYRAAVEAGYIRLGRKARRIYDAYDAEEAKRNAAKQEYAFRAGRLRGWEARCRSYQVGDRDITTYGIEEVHTYRLICVLGTSSDDIEWYSQHREYERGFRVGFFEEERIPLKLAAIYGVRGRIKRTPTSRYSVATL